MRIKKKHHKLRPKRLSIVFFHNPTFCDNCKRIKNKSWRRCQLYFRGRMQCWWIFDFETDYKVGTGCKEAGEKDYVGNISGNLQHL
jgi:hypothetical protein